jgi:hypothetical protein
MPFKALVSLGKTKSVEILRDSFAVFVFIQSLFKQALFELASLAKLQKYLSEHLSERTFCVLVSTDAT